VFRLAARAWPYEIGALPNEERHADLTCGGTNTAAFVLADKSLHALEGMRTADPVVQAAYICANFYKRYSNLRSRIADLEPRTD